jgi:hypothetical protein
MTDVHVSEQDVQSLAEKLAAFTRTLSPGELAAFELLEEQLLLAFVTDEPDVQAFEFGPLDAMAADARRTDLLRQAQARTDDGRVRAWSSLLETVTRLRSAGG